MHEVIGGCDVNAPLSKSRFARDLLRFLTRSPDMIRMEFWTDGRQCMHRQGETMIVDRRVFYLKFADADRAIRMAVEELNRMKWDRPSRLHRAKTGRFATLALEMEFESLAEYEKFWADWDASPESSAFQEKWNDVNETGGSHELWQIVES